LNFLFKFRELQDGLVDRPTAAFRTPSLFGFFGRGRRRLMTAPTRSIAIVSGGGWTFDKPAY
jgi:hypothetical protein